MNKEKITIRHIVAEAKPGVTEVDAIRDALHLAVEQWQNVHLIFNGKRLHVNVMDMLTAVKE